MYDIAIVGGGPAGSCLAMLLASVKGLKIAVIDKRELQKPYEGEGYIKSCGGLLAPDAQKTISRMGLDLPKEVLATPQIFCVRTIDLKRNLERFYQRFYINMDREKFDRFLASKIDAENAETFFGYTVSGIRYNEKEKVFCVSMRSRGNTKEPVIIRANMLVGADGAMSIVRRKLFPKLKFKEYVSLQEVFHQEHNNNLPYFSSLFHPKITDYYAWSLPKDDTFIFGAAIPAGKGAIKKYEELKEMVKDFGYDLKTPLRKEGTVILRTTGLTQIPKGYDDKAYLIGEAGGYISPSSAEGISYAFNSAIKLYESIRKAREEAPFDSKAYYQKIHSNFKRKVVPLRCKIVLKCLKKPFMYQPTLRYLVMKSKLKAIHMIEKEGPYGL